MAQTLLYLINPEGYFKGVIEILKTDTINKNIIYVTTNKPYSHLINTFNEYGIDTNRIFFIDCISKHVGEGERNVQNCMFLDGPQSLTQLSISINESVKSLPGKKVLLMDSLSFLLVYNDAKTMSKFSNFLINKMRVSDVDTIIIALESDLDKDILKQVQSYVDEIRKK